MKLNLAGDIVLGAVFVGFAIASAGAMSFIIKRVVPRDTAGLTYERRRELGLKTFLELAEDPKLRLERVLIAVGMVTSVVAGLLLQLATPLFLAPPF